MLRISLTGRFLGAIANEKRREHATTPPNNSLDRSAISRLFIRKSWMPGSLLPRPVNSNVRRLRGLVARHKGKLRAMKNTHTCPKCNSREIMRIEGRIGGYSGGNDIAGTAGSWSFRTVKVTRYLCGSCGFSEEWIDAPEDLHKLKEKYGSS